MNIYIFLHITIYYLQQKNVFMYKIFLYLHSTINTKLSFKNKKPK